jgi:hypothetical protein
MSRTITKYNALLKTIPDLGEDAVKRTWRAVRHSTVLSSGQKKRLINTLNNRKHVHSLRRRLHTVRRNLVGAGKISRRRRAKSRRRRAKSRGRRR